MDFTYSFKCARCDGVVEFRNSSRCLHLAYLAMQEFKDPEIAIAHSLELMEFYNELARGKDFIVVSYDRHIYPNGKCCGSPDVTSLIDEDFLAREAFELISMEPDRDDCSPDARIP
jgi:hypothetical protein